MRRITIKDVAREAGVSISTVSNALNNVGVISEKTRRHVIEVAERLNYIPNRSGQALRMQDKRAIGLFVNELAGAYYGVLADSLQQECEKRGYELYIFITRNDETVLQKILGNEVSAAVIFCNTSPQLVERLDEMGFPAILLNTERCSDRISSVAFDSYHAGELAARYLTGLGHKRMMLVAGLEHNYDSIHRERGFCATLSQQGIPLHPDYRIEGSFARHTAYSAMKAFLRSGKPLPDAIFATNDVSAYGCLEALRDEHIHVPDDVSLIGCDDIELSEICTPSLTTIRTNFGLQGGIALQYLLDIMGGESCGSVHTIPCQLVVRNSCKAR